MLSAKIAGLGRFGATGVLATRFCHGFATNNSWRYRLPKAFWRKERFQRCGEGEQKSIFVKMTNIGLTQAVAAPPSKEVAIGAGVRGLFLLLVVTHTLDTRGLQFWLSSSRRPQAAIRLAEIAYRVFRLRFNSCSQRNRGADDRAVGGAVALQKRFFLIRQIGRGAFRLTCLTLIY
jgi:hypothetical protein